MNESETSTLPDHETFMRLADELAAGQMVDVKLEYHETKDEARMQLLWSSPSTPRSIVPHSQLHPNPNRQQRKGLSW
jgi:hypothetical protein